MGMGRSLPEPSRTGEDFELKGNLELEAENYPSDLEDKVGGNLSITPVTREQNQYAGASEGFSIFSFILGLLAALALGFILIYTFPGFVTGLAEIVRGSALKAGLLGFVLLIFVPVLSVNPANYNVRVESFYPADADPGPRSPYRYSTGKTARR